MTGTGFLCLISIFAQEMTELEAIGYSDSPEAIYDSEGVSEGVSLKKKLFCSFFVDIFHSFPRPPEQHVRCAVRQQQQQQQQQQQ